FDPLPDCRDLLLGERFAETGVGHPFFGVIRRDAQVKFALVGLARRDHAGAIAAGKEPFLGIKPQVGLALVLVRAVALKAVLRQDGPDIAIEIDGLPRRLLRRGGWITWRA